MAKKHGKPIKKQGQLVERHRNGRTDWFHPARWATIDSLAQKYNWSPADIAKHLPSTLGTLNKGTVSRWIDKSGGKTCWKARILMKVEESAQKQAFLSTRDAQKLLGCRRVLVCDTQVQGKEILI